MSPYYYSLQHQSYRKRAFKWNKQCNLVYELQIQFHFVQYLKTSAKYWTNWVTVGFSLN